MNRSRTLKAMMIFSLAVFALAPGRSEAGASFGTPTANCWKNSNGSGGCQGSLAAFRASSDPNAYAEVFGNAGTYKSGSFYASLNGQNLTCTSTVPDVVNALIALASHAGFFLVGWDATGTCTNVVAYGISGYN